MKKNMNNIVENQGCDGSIKEGIYIIYLLGLLIYLTYGLISVLIGAYHIYK